MLRNLQNSKNFHSTLAITLPKISSTYNVASISSFIVRGVKFHLHTNKLKLVGSYSLKANFQLIVTFCASKFKVCTIIYKIETVIDTEWHRDTSKSIITSWNKNWLNMFNLSTKYPPTTLQIK